MHEQLTRPPPRWWDETGHGPDAGNRDEILTEGTTFRSNTLDLNHRVSNVPPTTTVPPAGTTTSRP